jgi:glycosyltransferase involved in cell wall biosynthesis
VRILYFTRDYTPHDYRFLSSLAETEHEVFSLRLERHNRQLEDRPLPLEVKQVRWRGGQAPFAWSAAPGLSLALRQVLRQVQPDVVHAGPVPSVAFLAALSGARPLVSMSWGSDLLHDIDADHWQRWCARFALQRSKVLVGDCQAVKDKAVSLGFAAERVRLFPWGVDLERFVPGTDSDFRERRGWQDAFVLLSLRSWELIYGVDVVVRAFGRTASRIPDLRLILLGGGSLAGQIRALILENGLEERVFLGGQVKNTDLPGYYRAADLYVSASHSDGSSVSLMEALATGRPALVSDIPGNKEWITPGREGWLFSDGDVDGLAEGILRAYDQRQKLGEMGLAARRLAEQRADWRKNFQVLLEVYQMAINEMKGNHK